MPDGGEPFDVQLEEDEHVGAYHSINHAIRTVASRACWRNWVERVRVSIERKTVSRRVSRSSLKCL